MLANSGREPALSKITGDSFMRLFFTPPFLAAILAFLGTGLVHSSSAKADSTGLEALHTLTRVGSRLCMNGHFHYGSGHSNSTKAAALADAKRKWASFVIAEYGTDWGRFSRAAAKGGHCTGTRGNWQCNVSASPCKLLRRAPRMRTARRHMRRHYRNRRAIARRHKARRHMRAARRHHKHRS